MKSEKILLIENDHDICRSVKEILEMEGFQVEVFFDEKSALDRLHKNPECCLILLDLLMPIMSGWSFMEEFLKLPVTIFPVPAYLFSALTEKLNETQDMGARGFIKKPVSLELLVKIVSEHCESSFSQKK
jgi:CheY-like chemotaxis protein